MPKQTYRERLADLEMRQRRIAEEILTARHAVRGKYADILDSLPIEQMSERVFRDIIMHAIRVGGEASLAVLMPLPTFMPTASKSLAKGVPAASTASPRAAGRDQRG